MADNSIVHPAAQHEHHKVARLVAHLPEKLVQIWKTKLKRDDLVVTSMFCHHRPMVEYNATPPFADKSPAKPELGDLMLLITTPDSNKNLTQHGLLLQAKLEEGTDFKIEEGSPWVQRYMYSEWPPFKMNIGTGNTFDIAPKDCDDTWTRYVCITKSGNAPLWNVEGQAAQKFAIPSNNILKKSTQTFPTHHSLGKSIVFMIRKKLGRNVHDDSDWSRVVHEIKKWANEVTVANKKPWGVAAAVSGLNAPHINSAQASFMARYALMPDPLSFLTYSFAHKMLMSRRKSPEKSMLWNSYTYVKNDEIHTWHPDGRGGDTPIEESLVNFDSGGFGIINISILNPIDDLFFEEDLA